MLTILLFVGLAQGGLPPVPEAIPRADPRMILNDIPARRPSPRANRRLGAVSYQLSYVLKQKDLKLTKTEFDLIVAVWSVLKPEAFDGNAAALEKLRAAVERMRAGLRKVVLDAMGEIELPPKAH